MQDILKLINNNKLKIIVKPNSSKSEILEWDDDRKALRVSIKAVPDKGKANKEVERLFSKILKKKVKICLGLKSREKILEII